MAAASPRFRASWEAGKSVHWEPAWNFTLWDSLQNAIRNIQAQD
jgi:hypothetical protein